MKQGLLDEIIENYYQKCVGLPTGKPIVRQKSKRMMHLKSLFLKRYMERKKRN